jgi:hypothetical protein
MDKYIECVEDINKMMDYDEKLAEGTILQVWCLNSFSNELERILTDFKYTLKSTHCEDSNNSKTFDIDFESTSEASRFRQLVSMNRYIKVYINLINVSGYLYPKPDQESVKKKKEFLIKENCQGVSETPVVEKQSRRKNLS